MKSNKSGFTLMELLGVVVILGLLITFTFPSIINTIKNSSEEVNELSTTLVNNAAELYIKNSNGYYDATNGTEFCISISDLVAGDYIKTPIQYNDLDDITLTHSVKVTYNDGYNYEILENNSCPAYVCKRATKLHTEECTQTNTEYYCSGSGYTIDNMGTTITYGSLGTNGKLTSGDAFDCDVNGDGTYDSTTERFYYVTDLDNSTATLIYYNNTTLGEPDNTSTSIVNYYSEDEYSYNNLGPITAVINLPTTSQWNNVSLKNNKRQIVNEIGLTTTYSGNIKIFDYSNYAARLLTFQEIEKACNKTSIEFNIGELGVCNYLLENTVYSSNLMGTNGYLLETPFSESQNLVFGVYSANVSFTKLQVNGTESFGVRPLIEVKKYNIEY